MHIVDTSQLTTGLVLADALIKDNITLVEKFKVLDTRDINLIQKNFKFCKIYSLRELEPYIIRNDSFSGQYIHFLVKHFNSLFSSVVNNTKEFEKLAFYISQELQRNREVLFSLIRLRQNHLYTYEHSTNVAMLSLELGLTLEITDYELHSLVLGAILHDLGKLYIDNRILDKPSGLTNEEFEVIKAHPDISASLTYNLQGLNPRITSIAREHHEKLDGSGYPYGLKGYQISPLSRIVTVCDIFDAVTSERSYHHARSYSDCAKILSEDAKNGKLDSYLVQTMISKTVMYPLDTYVRLSNGVSGFVVVEDAESNRPVIYDYSSKKLYNLKFIKDARVVYAI